jgi:intracellular multiplication protein IcmD
VINSNKGIEKKRKPPILTGMLLLLLAHGCVWAASDLGDMAKNILVSFTELAKLITAGAYLAGLAFAVGAIMKFKQHKDNPTNIPIGTPIALTFIAAALLFLPSILKLTGGTMFQSGGKTAGPSGTVFTSK